MTLQPWARTGPGTPTDGKPKSDLSTSEPADFNRLRDRVIMSVNRASSDRHGNTVSRY